MTTCYIEAPYGVKQGEDGREIDFDQIYRELIKPAIERSGLNYTRGDEHRSGIAHKAVFSALLESDLMIADTSTNNANVLYNLGIRHASHEIKQILKRFTTIESLFDQTNDEIALLTNVKEWTVDAIKAELHELTN